jgi:Zn ribbon nucleic-acid-binding protein
MKTVVEAMHAYAVHVTRCVACGFTSDDPVEAAGHLRDHEIHPAGHDCGRCQYVRGAA